MSIRYPHILSPVKVGRLLLKNRLLSTNSLPHFLQGPETWPADPTISHVVDMAKNGAAVVTFADWTDPTQRDSMNEDGKRFPMLALDSDPSVENYLCQMADQVHYYNSFLSLALITFRYDDPVYDVSDFPAAGPSTTGSIFQPDLPQPRFGEMDMSDPLAMTAMFRGPGVPGKQLTKEMIAKLIERWAQRVKKYQSLGFDMVTLHGAYCTTLISRFLSPRTNFRTDEYGGSAVNRARFAIELGTRIKELCGKDFPVELQITPSEDNGQTIEETIEMARAMEGAIDIFQFRAQTQSLNHPTGYNSTKHKYLVLEDCAKVKASGTSILCGPVGGFQDLNDMEQALAEGKCDLISGARLFICDYDYYRKIKEGRGEDVVPCIRCNKCHVPHLDREWLSYCSVNPLLGINHRIGKLVEPVTKKRNVAIVGGGPAGMRAALFGRQRGYDVTLFEASDHLGGQLAMMDCASFKWPLVQYRNWLISQLYRSGAEVRLNTPATKELLQAGGYDAVILALGAVPKKPPIPGADSEKVYDVFTAFGSEAKMGRRVVVVGGSESATECGLYLAEHGHSVLFLTRGHTLAADSNPIHYVETIEDYYRRMEDVDYIDHATTTEIGEGYVRYIRNGEEHTVECDDVVALGGMRPLQEEAMELYGVAADTLTIGDCLKVGNIHECNRLAFSSMYNLT